MTNLIRTIFIALGCIHFLAGAQAHAATFSTLAAFPASDEGQYPYARPIAYGKAIYGTTASGGRYFSGTIYRMEPATGVVTTVYSFTGGAGGTGPGPLLRVGRLFYGTISGNAPYTFGTVFSFDPAAGKLATIFSFSGSDGEAPQGTLTEIDGSLYGATFYGGPNGEGVAFKIDLASGAETVLHEFTGGTDGMFPSSGLVQSGAFLYGTTQLGGSSANDGTLFRIDIASGKETVLHRFTGIDGAEPNGAFVLSHGVLYGAATDGGSYGWGCVYAYDIKGRTESVLHSFSDDSNGSFPAGGLTDVGGTLYGTTFGGTGNLGGTIFTIDPATGQTSTVYSFITPSVGGDTPVTGVTPISALLDVGGKLYGTTAAGGIVDGGSLYSFDLATGNVAFLHDFIGVGTGQYVNGSLLQVGSVFYGTTPQGGGARLGGIFKLDPAKGKIENLFSFTGAASGYDPLGSLILQGDLLYGTTHGGYAPTSAGTAFSFDPSAKQLTTLFGFDDVAIQGTNGSAAFPNSALLPLAGALVGTSSGMNGGAVYSIVPGQDVEHTIERTLTIFPVPNGVFVQPPPGGGLLSVGSLLYGTSFRGGARGYGFVYSVDPSAGQTTTVYSFQNETDGANPGGGLVSVNGILYGTTTTGGTGYNGTLFALDPTSGAVTTLHSFDAYAGGCKPVATLLAVGNMLYGTGEAGAAGYGTIFSYDIDAARYTVLYTFTAGADGGAPQAALISDGEALYGTTSFGGSFNRGTAFKIVP